MRNEEGEGKDEEENERREKKKGLKRNGKEEFLVSTAFYGIIIYITYIHYIANIH